jgi:hypothetical protein
VSESRSRSHRASESFADIEPTGQDEDGHQAALERSQSVLEHQLEALADLDSKAVWTVRLEVVLLGVLASVTRTFSDVTVNVVIRLGGTLLVCSIISGIVTYSASRPDAGPGPRYLHSVASSKADAAEWYLEILDGYEVAISHNRTVIEHNVGHLFRTQLLFVLGVVLIAVGLLLVA